MYGQADGHTHARTHKISASALRSPELLAQIYLKLSEHMEQKICLNLQVFISAFEIYAQ
jgi:hypothetical protein